MQNTVSPSLILLTYKGKILLMNKSNSVIDKEKHPWSFIGEVIKDTNSFKNAFVKRVEKEMGVKIEEVNFVSDFCYHAELTDDNVNNIKRSDTQLLNFFTLKELKNLLLSSPTEQFITKHSAVI